MTSLSPASAPAPLLNRPRFERVGALAALLGILLSFFGLSWDIQWHADVGPDTFWTLPHLFVYAGSALTGLACLSVSLISSGRSGRQPDPAWIPVLGGRFHAPIGFVVAGLGALGFLLFGLFDQWWHLIYGFDVSISSPPHVGLLFSLIASMVGSTLIFIQGRRLRPLEFSVSVAASLGFALPITMMILDELGQSAQYVVFPALFISLGMLLVASATRSVWWVLGMTLIFFAFRSFNWYGVPLFNQNYADALGYSLRENVPGFAWVPFLTPMFAPFAGLLVCAVLSVWKRRPWNAAVGAAVSAGLAAPILYLDGTVLQLGQTPLLIPVVMGIGATFGWIGWQLGVVLRHGEHSVHSVHSEDGARPTPLPTAPAAEAPHV